MIIDASLAHFGVKGMKWGIRKDRRSGGRPEKTRTSYKKAPAKLTDAELNRRLKRMELEKRYNELNNHQTDGQKFAKSVLENSGRSVVSAVVVGSATFFVQRALKAKFG